MGFDYKAGTTLSIAISVIGYVFVLIRNSNSQFGYGTTSGSSNLVLGFLGWLFSGVLRIASVTGLPDWANALFTIPVTIIIFMWALNK